MTVSKATKIAAEDRSLDTLYRKIGKRYVPELDTYAYLDGLPRGDYLLSVRPGSRGLMRVADVDGAFLAIAAIRDLQGIVLAELHKVAKYEPDRKMIARHKRAYAAYREIMGDDPEIRLVGPAPMDIAEAVARAVVERTKEGGERCGS